MAYEHVGPLPPSNPQDWWLWLKTPQLQEWLYLPHGEWILHQDLANGPGIVLTEGGALAGRVDGAHGHLPSWLADALKTLKMGGESVVTEHQVAEMAKEVVKAFAPKQAVVVDGKLGVSLDDLVVTETSLVLFKTDGDPVTLPDDMLPAFKDGTKPSWDHCVVVMVPMLGQPSLPLGAKRFHRVLGSESCTLQANRNCGYPMGAWVRRVHGEGAPVYRAAYQDNSGTIPSLACNCTIWGFR